MNNLKEAISWNGSNVTMSMFVIAHGEQPQGLQLQGILKPPPVIRRYELKDDDKILKDLRVFEYDMVWHELPEDLEKVIQSALEEAIESGAVDCLVRLRGII